MSRPALDPVADEIRELEKSRIQALVARDMDRIRQLHARDYQLITPSGRSFSRDRYFSELESGRLRYLRWEPGPIDVRVSAQMAVVRYQVTLELDRTGGGGTPFQCWHIDSYECEHGVWQAVWSQATAIR